MKKNVLHILAALISLLVVSCAKQDIHPVEGTPAVPEDPWTVILAKEESAPDGPVTRLTAGFAPTKAGLVMNPSRTFAAQHWESGDQFCMFGFTSDLSGIQSRTYSTEQSGASVEFSGSTIPDTHQSHGLFCLYPNSAYTTPGRSSGKPVIRAVIPQEQTAREGTADPAALLSVFRRMDEVLGVVFFGRAAVAEVPPEVQALVDARAAARAAKNWAESDRLRAEIAAAGWVVKDSRDGQSLSPAAQNR